uniref:Uncharacterized protein AlNc14C207G8836 n=1 Tax=Albugo laibachii Nc14 TaxID=890382 RepID=F0WR28_9STRA|nr:conserved hypothetical protein [Albugo laibachii Nc14]|eukprot:CCA23788.1 conserved hypothetical protein [Albugo laibachii Nc14]
MPRHSFDDDDDNLLLALQNIEPCGNCGADGARLPCMSGCGEVFYCSRECMMHHASAHRLRCRNLRCSKFNDSDSGSGSSDEDEISDSEEYETGSEEEVEVEKAHEEVKKNDKAKKKKGKSNSRKPTQESNANHARDAGDGVSACILLGIELLEADIWFVICDLWFVVQRVIGVDAEAERRIEEKILRRLRKQEESRIATAIEQRMKEEKANWRDEEMNRIIIDMRERIQREMKNATTLVAMAKKNGVSLETLVSSDIVQKPNSDKTNADTEEVEAFAPKVSHGSLTRSESRTSGKEGISAVPRPSKSPTWNNACAAFEALRVVVWKHSFLPDVTFDSDSDSGIWNKIVKIDADSSFNHIVAGDHLLFVNGRPIDSTVRSEDDLDDVFAAFASPLVLKFRASNPHNGTVQDYSVTWSNGPLGVTLKDDCTSDKVPIVNRLTKKAGSVAVKQNIAIGDVLVAINNIDTIQLGCSLSMSILKKVQLPAQLRFRGKGGPLNNTNDVEEPEKPSSTSKKRLSERKVSSCSGTTHPSHYTVRWDQGPLGLTIIPGLTQHDLPVIKKVTGTGTSKGIEQAQVGDFLVSMNETYTESMPFEDIVAYLKSTSKPVVLRFRTATEEDAIRPSTEILAQNMRDCLAVNSNDAAKSQQDRSPNYKKSSKTMQRHYSTSDTAIEVDRTPLSSGGKEANKEVYSILWGSGSLGLTIDAIPHTSRAYIKRIASQGAAAHLTNKCLGDELTHINEMDVRSWEFPEIVSQLKTVPRPVTLHFVHSNRSNLSASCISSTSSKNSLSERHSDASQNISPNSVPPNRNDSSKRYYNLVWQDGLPLGLSLRSADSTSQYPYITRVTGTGCASHLPATVSGDALISVDGRSVHEQDKTFDEVMTLLRNMPKPLNLRFEARGSAHRCASSSNLAGNRKQQRPVLETPPRKPLSEDGTSWKQQNRAPNFVSTFSGGFAASSTSVSKSGNTFSSSSVSHTSSSPNTEEEKLTNIQAPFLVQNKLSTNRRQKMLKGLRK